MSLFQQRKSDSRLVWFGFRAAWKTRGFLARLLLVFLLGRFGRSVERRIYLYAAVFFGGEGGKYKYGE